MWDSVKSIGYVRILDVSQLKAVGTLFIRHTEKLLAGFLRVVKLLLNIQKIQITSLVIDSNILTVYGSSSDFQNGLGIWRGGFLINI